MEKLIIQAKKVDGTVKFCPTRVVVEETYSRYQALAHGDESEDRWFDAFDEAARVVASYENHPGFDDDVVSMTWDYVACAWEVTEWRGGRRSGRGAREDFHADG